MYFLLLLPGRDTERRGVKMVQSHSMCRQSHPSHHHSHAPGWAEKTEAFLHDETAIYIQLSHRPKAELQHSRKLCFIQIASNTPQLAFTMSYVKFTGQMGVPAGASSLHRLQPTTDRLSMPNNRLGVSKKQIRCAKRQAKCAK